MVLVAGLTAGACNDKPRPTPVEAPKPRLNRVVFAGCNQVRTGRVCEVTGPAQITLWVDTPDTEARPTVVSDGAATPVQWRVVDGGLQTQLTVTTATRSIALNGEPPWHLKVVAWQRPKVLQTADGLRKQQKFDEAEAALTALDSGNVREQSEAETMRAKMAGARGESKDAIAHALKAAQLAEQAGLLSKPVRDRAVAAFHAIHNTRDMKLARTLIEQMRAAKDFDEAGMRADYYAGVLARSVGDSRTSVRLLRKAEESAQRLQIESSVWASRGELANAFMTLGDHEQALSLHKLLTTTDEGNLDCPQATRLGNLAFANFLAVDAGLAVASELDAGLQSQKLFSGRCPDRLNELNMATTIALLALAEGRTELAREFVQAARSIEVVVPSYITLWLLEAEARLALADRRWSHGLRALVAMDQLAKDSALAGGQWRAAVGSAQLRQAQGRFRAALEWYKKAERLLEDDSLDVEIGGARGLFFASRNRQLNEHIELLLAQAQPKEAVAVIRRSRARVVRGLSTKARVAALSGQRRAEWDQAVARYTQLRDGLDESLSAQWGQSQVQRRRAAAARAKTRREIAEALDAAMTALAVSDMSKELPAITELTLGFHRTNTGWVGFAVSGKDSRVVQLGPGEEPTAPKALARRFLQPFSSELDASPSVRFLVPAELAGIDFHALPWRDGPLLASHVVSYGVDLAPSAKGPNVDRALIVADPQGNLPNARDEATAVAAALRKRKWEIQTLSGRAVTRKDLLAAFSSTTHLHYAGHGTFAGPGGWSSRLPMAQGANLTVGDILALESVPSTVVLSGCETGRTSKRTGVQLGLAQAFVLAGAQAAVGATRNVKDETARALAEALYGADTPQLGAALRKAQLQLMTLSPGLDWAAFRVIAR